MFQHLTNVKCPVNQESEKYEQTINEVLNYILSGVKLDEDNKVDFNVADYFCITDIAPAQLLTYIRRYKKDMNVADRKIISSFLSRYQDLDMLMTIDRFDNEAVGFIINGEKVFVTHEMWENIFKQFAENSIPTNRRVLYSVTRRSIEGKTILPLAKTTKEKQFVK